MARGRGGRSLRLILALLLGVVGAAPAHAQPVEVRVVTLRAVAEEMYRARPGWETELRRTVKAVSDVYEQNFQIRFVIRDIVPWTVGPSVPLRTILRRLRREVPIGSADVLVGFAAERCERLEYGVASLFGRVAMVQTACLDTAVLSNTTAEAVLSHEMGHLFGAFHPAPSHDVSVMRGGPADRFDSQSLRVIRLMRTFDFTRGVQSVDAAARQAWSAIYAEGHPRDEPNPLAGAIGNEGARLASIGREQEGEALLREALTLDPSAPRVHTMLGLLYQRQSRLPEAARELDAAKRLSFRETEARTELGFVFLQLGRDDEALTELRDVLRVDRRLARAHLGIGMIMERRDRMPEAIGAFRSAITLEPKDGQAYLQLALALDRASQPGEAWAAAQQAHDLGEDVPADFWPRVAAKVPNAPALPPACGAATGPVIDLDNPDSASREYVAKVRERIKVHIAYPRLAGERRQGGQLQVELQIARSGRLECLALRHSSGSEILDRHTMDSVRLAQPFPPLPPQMPQSSLAISGTFGYRILDEPPAPAPAR